MCPFVVSISCHRQSCANTITLFERRTRRWYELRHTFHLASLTEQILITRFQQNPEARQSLPAIAFADYGRRYQAPALDEGFEDIIPVEFQFKGTEEEKKLWAQYWV